MPAGSLAAVRAIRISEFGGPEVLELADLPIPEPAEGQVRVKVSRAGVNFADTHTRENSYLAKQELPLVPGGEVAGTIDGAAGDLQDGQRVVALVPNGGYAEYALAPAAGTFPIPEDLDESAALALTLQGLSAWHLYRTAAQLREGETVVVHAAAGGVGSLAVQLAKPFGAGRIIATASSEEKRRLALDLGADAAIDVNADDLAGALREANGGHRVDVVLEMAGGRVFDQSLDALAPFGRLVTYGLASREQSEVSNARLLRTSRAVVGFWLAHCFRRPEMIGPPLRDLFERAASGSLKPVEGGTYPLSEARRVHEDLQARRTTGKLLLDPAR
jgi:NADPH:quinone reductase